MSETLSKIFDSITSSTAGRIATGIIGVALIVLGGIMIVKNLVGLLEGFGGLVLILVGIFLLSLVA